MTIEPIIVGTTANSSNGESLRSAFEKINRNFEKVDNDVISFTTAPTLENGEYVGDRKTLISKSLTPIIVSGITVASLEVIDIVWNGDSWIKVG